MKHNWVLPPLGRDNAGRRGEERRETAYSPARSKLLERNLVRWGTEIKVRGLLCRDVLFS